MQASCIAGPSRLPELFYPKCRACTAWSGYPRRFFTTSSQLPAKEAAAGTSSTLSQATTKPDKAFSGTLLLPKTSFPLRADAPKREKTFKSRMTSKLYEWQWQQKDRPLFVLHDGPPYANGNLHAGHALNKILKDVINRYKVLRGYRVHYQPGWDCHGLPIEHKALQQLEADHRDLSPGTIRKAARQMAEESIEIQKKEFEQFALMADLDSNIYKTFDRKYKIRQLRVFQKMVEKGLIFRAAKPVLWSPSSRTALAEAEISYKDDHVSESAFVKFPITSRGPEFDALCAQANIKPTEAHINLIVWTTTPWTLPANMFVAYAEEIEYSLVTFGDASELYVVASERVAYLSKVSKQDLQTRATFKGHVLADVTYRAPFGSTKLPMTAADYVTADSGTGLVHSAPAHGAEDYQHYRDHLLKPGSSASNGIICPVDADGLFCKEDTGSIDSAVLSKLEGTSVLGDGSKKILEMLREKDLLVATVKIRHKYPYDWKTKLPVIYRTTPQWFANLDKIKDNAVEALQSVNFVPSQGRNRLEAFVRGRSEWCISRQRAWGVPIPALYDTTTGEAILDTKSIEYIISVLQEKGFAHWWEGPVEDFLLPELRSSAQTFVKGTDTMDVWFDSGTSWMSIQDSLRDDGLTRSGPIAEVYLEGSDQHRGWFQSSLLTSIAATGQAPYSNIITHGFVLDEKGTKMSKSEGNVISPLTLINGGKDKGKEPAFGADALRYWATSSAYTKEVNMSQDIAANAAEGLRKIRNTVRFILGNLGNNTQPLPVEAPNMSIVDRYILHELAVLSESATQAYDNFTFNKAISHLSNFCNTTLSSFYFVYAKDPLYNDMEDSERRQAILWTLRQILPVITSIMAPAVPHLAEDIWQNWPASMAESATTENQESVFKMGWRAVDQAWLDESLASQMELLKNIRTEVLNLLEQARTAKHLRSPAEAHVDIIFDESASHLSETISRNSDILANLLTVSSVALRTDAKSDASASSKWEESAVIKAGEGGKVSVLVRKSVREKCPRCWMYTREETEETCGRCTHTLAGRA